MLPTKGCAIFEGLSATDRAGTPRQAIGASPLRLLKSELIPAKRAKAVAVGLRRASGLKDLSLR